MNVSRQTASLKLPDFVLKVRSQLDSTNLFIAFCKVDEGF